jgi:hypothetical protein
VGLYWIGATTLSLLKSVALSFFVTNPSAK